MIDDKILEEWDWQKNAAEGFFPDQMMPHSNKKAHWKCKLGHEWIDTVSHRTSGRNCPYCSNHRLLVGFNDLASRYPEVAKEWDYEQNGTLQPSDVVFGCTKSVWWKCSACGNRWQAKVTDRTKRSRGCPKCSLAQKGQKQHIAVLNAKGSMRDQLLLREWNYEKNGGLLPENFTSGSNQIVWWKCSKCSSEWRAKITNRTHGRGCPYCWDRKIRVGFNDLATTHPQLAKEWDYEKNGDLTPQQVTHGSGRKIWWKCPLGHSYQADLLHRTGGTNCPICNSGRQTSFAEQALYYYIKKLFPDTINRYRDIFDKGMELDIFIPSILLAIEYDGVFWHKGKEERERRKYHICHQNHIRLIRIREAPFTNETEFGIIADEMYHIDNMDDRYNLEQLLTSFLMKFTRWSTNMIGRRPDVDLERDELEIRQQYLLAQRAGSLDKTHPMVAKEWNYEKNGKLVPSMFQSGSSIRVWWKCSICGHEWKTSISHRTNGGGCEKCYRRNNRGGSHPKAVCIYQYDIEGNFIKKWDCIKDAATALSLNPANLGSCARHQRAKAGGYRWEFTYLPHLTPIVEGLYKKILQYDKEGNFIKEYPSLIAASKELNIDATTISKALHGQYHTAGGYIWKLQSST